MVCEDKNELIENMPLPSFREPSNRFFFHEEVILASSLLLLA